MPPPARVSVRFGVTAVAMALWYLVAAAAASREELVAAAVVGSAAAIAVLATVGPDHFLPPQPWRALAAWWRLPGMVIRGTGTILGSLLLAVVRRRPVGSLLTAVPFHADDDVGGRWRTALAIAGTCAAPDTVVLAVLAERQLLLYHQLSDAPVPVLTQRLGAEP